MTDLEQQLTDHLERRAADVIPRYDLAAVERGIGSVELVHHDDRRSRRPLYVAFAAAAAAAVIGVAFVGMRTPDDQAATITPPDGPAPSVDTSPTETVAERPPTQGGMWPQSNVDEVRAARELADAGDPDYTWQVDPQLSTGLWQEYLLRNPNTVEIVARFLREVLGWDSYVVVQGGDTAQSSGDFTLAGLVYLRCAPDETNPLYLMPVDGWPGAECAPTIDDFSYEAVNLNLSQLAGQGPDGIWVVSSWEITEPFMQADPIVAEAEATADLEDFLRARIAGEGAEGSMGATRGDQEVPLLYATTTGAPYERYEIDLESGPAWPDGWMEFTVRLYANGGESVVEQRFHGLPGDLSYASGQTTENDQPAAVSNVFLDGTLTVSAPASWVPSRVHDEALDRSPEDSSERIEFVGDPRPGAIDCAAGPMPADAEALSASLQSDPDLVSTTPVVVNIGGLGGLEMDVTVAPSAGVCRRNGDESTLALVHGEHGYVGAQLPGVALEVGSRTRLYLLDTPEGSTTPVLAIAVVAPEASFDTVVEEVATILESIEFDPTSAGAVESVATDLSIGEVLPQDLRDFLTGEFGLALEDVAEQPDWRETLPFVEYGISTQGSAWSEDAEINVYLGRRSNDAGMIATGQWPVGTVGWVVDVDNVGVGRVVLVYDVETGAELAYIQS